MNPDLKISFKTIDYLSALEFFANAIVDAEELNSRI
jgi:hypothetical protein